MFEPPSDALVRKLLNLQLCTQRDLGRCRRIVARLASNLPAFDSVWLDALVQLRRITPFQARMVEAGRAYDLAVGPYLLVDRISSGLLGETFLARRRVGNDRVVIKLLKSEYGGEIQTRLANAIEALRCVVHPGLAIPTEVLKSGTRLAVVTRYVPGPHLGELLVRRGRFPPAVALEIARQLTEALLTLRSLGLNHGEIRLENIRLTAGGQVVLVDTAVRCAVLPSLTVHLGWRPDACDTLAPELIGASESASQSADLYSLGCVLWHILAGRPPFPGGDPLGKLMAHRTRTIDDIRRWAPETSTELAEGIRGVTRRELRERVTDIEELVQRWKLPGRASRVRVRRFVESFRRPPQLAGARHNAWMWVFAWIVLLSGGAAALGSRGVWPPTLSISAPVLTPVGSAPRATREPASGAVAPRPVLAVIPDPNPEGEIVLDSAGPYAARTISVIGPLRLTGGTGARPIIIVEDSFQLSATEVEIQNIHLVASPVASAEPTPKSASLLSVTTDRLRILQCSFRIPGGLSRRYTACAWKTVSARINPLRQAELQDVAIYGPGAGLYLASAAPVKSINCLKAGPGPWLSLKPSPAAGDTVVLQFEGSTLRGSGPLVRWFLPEGEDSGGNWRVETQGCVIDVGESGRLLDLVSADVREKPLERISFSGSGTIVRIGSEHGWWNPQGEALSPAENAVLAIEGLVQEPVKFAGSLTDRPTDSTLREYSGPKSASSSWPGILPDRIVLPPRQPR